MIKIQKKLSGFTHAPNHGAGFTLMELLIVIAFVGILATVVLVLINPLAQLDRARVAKGKASAALGLGNVWTPGNNAIRFADTTHGITLRQLLREPPARL